ncbi:MAG: MMPL family transporter [Candidatus Poseidoniaceae archaeon]|nr:MMPL family transporter [Candidatus Poseidoniaceae archaeon]
MSHHLRRGAIPFLVLAGLLTVALAANLMISPPTFKTDLSEFAPESESQQAHQRVHAYFPNETRPLFVHVTVDDGGNILALENLQLMSQHVEQLQNNNSMVANYIPVWTAAPSIVQLSLDEEANGTQLEDIESWNQMIDLLLDEDTECRLTSDDQLLSAATYASSALLNKDLDISPTCSYLESGTGDGTPTASSTLWVLEIDPNMDTQHRKIFQDQMRDEFAKLTEESELTYGVVSLDLISHDIDQGTFDNLATLIFLALLVVIILLSIAFRSMRGVIFPLIGLSSALIWTYGSLNFFGTQFSALEVAVAPLVLGLGIDYAIHLQRAYVSIREEYPEPAEAWARACTRLSVPLVLAVITTVAAFLANIISPLPPLATFGLALAIGVICAFLSATLVVGSLHIIFDAPLRNSSKNSITLPRSTDMLVKIQQKQQVPVILVAIIISGLSIAGASTLETDFDLADFIDSDMEIMSVRDDLSTSYDSAGWKMVYILMEPLEGENVIPDDEILLNQLRGLHADLESNHDVVGTDGRTSSPSYDGPYVVLRDAILRDSSFGDAYNMEVFAGEVFIKDHNGQLDLGAAFSNLSINQTVADALSGKTWLDRVQNTVNLQGEDIVHLRTEVRVESTTSSQSKRVVDNFERMLGSNEESGTLRATLSGHGEIYITGDLVILQTVLEGLSESQLESTLISLVVSSAVLLILTRRVLPAIIVLFPVGLSSLWVVGSMAALGLKWNVLTVMVTALTLGIGIDYSIHMWRRFEVELERNENHWEALRAALSTTGVALILSALTTALGFLVLLYSPMPVIQDFGLITAVTVLFSLMLALILLPVLVEMVERGKEIGKAS